MLVLDSVAAPRTLDVMNRLGRALADASRARILIRLLEGPAYPADLASTLGLTRSNVSNHLTCLRGCGLIAGVAEGRQVRYELVDPALAAAISALVDAVMVVDAASVPHAENTTDQSCGCAGHCADDGCCGPRA